MTAWKRGRQDGQEVGICSTIEGYVGIEIFALRGILAAYSCHEFGSLLLLPHLKLHVIYSREVLKYTSKQHQTHAQLRLTIHGFSQLFSYDLRVTTFWIVNRES